MILHEISLKDKEWRSFAYSLTKDKEKADDLVQEMYLRIYSKCQNKKLTDLYKHHKNYKKYVLQFMQQKKRQ